MSNNSQREDLNPSILKYRLDSMEKWIKSNDKNYKELMDRIIASQEKLSETQVQMTNKVAALEAQKEADDQQHRMQNRLLIGLIMSLVGAAVTIFIK